MAFEVQDGDIKPVEQILLPFITAPEGLSFDQLLENAIRQVRLLESAQRDALVNSLKLIILLPGHEEKFKFLSGIQTLADLGFGTTPNDQLVVSRLEAASTAAQKVVIIAEYIARKLLEEMGENIQE